MSRMFRNVVLLVCIPVFLGASTILFTDPAEKIRTYTRQIEFDYVNWTLDALWLKWNQLALGGAQLLPQANQPQVVLDYLELVRQIQELEAEVARFYADPEIKDPDAATREQRQRISALQQERNRQAPLAEAVFQEQLSVVLGEIGLSLGGQALPPVLYHVTPLPNALIVSPRERIEQQANISIDPDLTLDEVEALEAQVTDGLEVSPLVVSVGGVGLYPTMVMQTTDLNWLAEVVAHEWVHNFLTLRPLGASYLSSPELRTINETVASIAGKEIGRELIGRYYPELLPPPPELPAEPPADRQDPETPAPEPVFDFRAEMHHTRLVVDEMLAAGEVDKAELYMELRRRFMWENGYRIRKLNQAYFAFYGAYADQPGGAAGEDPVGEAVRTLRASSPDLTHFLKRISWMWSYDQLQRAVSSASTQAEG